MRRAKSQGQLEVDSILATFGLSFIGVGILLAIFGGEYLDYSYLAQPIFIFGERYGLNRVVAFLGSAALCAGLYLWLHQTRAGLALRAVSVNPGGRCARFDQCRAHFGARFCAGRSGHGGRAAGCSACS